jgi:hypothetical protein
MEGVRDLVLAMKIGPNGKNVPQQFFPLIDKLVAAVETLEARVAKLEGNILADPNILADSDVLK